MKGQIDNDCCFRTSNFMLYAHNSIKVSNTIIFTNKLELNNKIKLSKKDWMKDTKKGVEISKIGCPRGVNEFSYILNVLQNSNIVKS